MAFMMKDRKLLGMLGLLAVLLFSVLGCGQEEAEPTTAIQGAVVAPLVEKQEPNSATHTVKILGKEGFSSGAINIQAQDTIVFVNLDPRKKAAVITFQKDSSRTFLNSEIIAAGASWKYSFDEPGEYQFWTVGYGVRGRIRVR